MKSTLEFLFSKGFKVIPSNGEYVIATIDGDIPFKRCKNATEVRVAAAIM